jgi:thiaminase
LVAHQHERTLNSESNIAYSSSLKYSTFLIAPDDMPATDLLVDPTIVDNRFSPHLWKIASSRYQRLKEHSFYEHYFAGNLTLKDLGYFISQDVYYLTFYAQCMKNISKMMNSISNLEEGIKMEYSYFFQQEEMYVYNYQKMFQNFLMQPALQQTMEDHDIQDKITPAMVKYIQHLQGHCISETSIQAVLRSISAVLPCLWSYVEIFYLPTPLLVNGIALNYQGLYFTSNEFLPVLKQMRFIFDDLVERFKITIKLKIELEDIFLKSLLSEGLFLDETMRGNGSMLSVAVWKNHERHLQEENARLEMNEVDLLCNPCEVCSCCCAYTCTAPCTSSPTSTPSTFPTDMPSTQPTECPSVQPSTLPSSQPTVRPTSQPTRQPSGRPSTQPTSRPSSQPLSHPTSQPSSQPTTQPTNKPTRQPTSQPTGRPSRHPSKQPTNQPTQFPSTGPTQKPSSQPSEQPTCQPNDQPTTRPTTQPSVQPTSFPSALPSQQPNSLPTAIPSRQPSERPTSTPSMLPTSQPSALPTSTPSSPPTSQPTLQPTGLPSVLPSSCTSSQPNCVPTMHPSSIPTQPPFSCPSSQPTSLPSNFPTCSPTLNPAVMPTNFPSSKPSSIPSLIPSTQPSSLPSILPSGQPSSRPSIKPSCTPFSVPSIQPTSRPSSQPSCYPTNLPTAKPSRQPSSQPTMQPSRHPTSKPSKQPSSHPSSQPTSSPITSSPTSIPTIITESPTPLRVPSISSYPSQTRKPTRQPITPRPTAIPTVRPSFLPTSAPTQRISIFPSGRINFKESLFFFGSYLPAVENIPNIYLTEGTIGASYIIFGFNRKKERISKEIVIGSRNSQGLYSIVMNDAGLIPDHTMSRTALPIGDFNGDSHEDLVICDPINSYCFLYFGRVNGFQNLQVSFAIKSNRNDLFGWSIAKMNDINRDNFDDFAISALSSNTVYVFFGSNSSHADVNIDQLDSSVGIKIIGSQNDQNSGVALSLAGDFNSDGHADILFTAIQITPYENVIYVLFLNSKTMNQNIIMDNLTPNKDYFKITAPLFSFAGFSLSYLGDINQDGFDDIIIGSIPYSGRYLTQKSYVIYGKNSSNTLALSEITEEDGFTITGGGFMVGGPGDVNGDGIPDIMIGSYQQWQGKGNSYIMVYPRNVTNPPTFHPSSQPTSVPFSSPTSMPSLIVREPTSTPTFEETTNEPVNEGTFPPFLEATQLPSLAPKTSKPTRSPSIKSTTYFPTIKTDLPSVCPSRNPTAVPTIRPTRSPNTKRPSRAPAGRPTTSHVTTSFPSLIVSESLATPFEEITIDRAGVYNGPSGKVNYIISGEGSFEIISYGGGNKIYTILPSKNSITITNLDKRYDQISLIHFPYLYSINDLVYGTSSLQIFLSNEQKIILPLVEASELTEGNFIFEKVIEDQNMNSDRLSFASMISLGILVCCIGVVVFLVKWNQIDEDDTDAWKDTLQDTDAVIVIDTNNESVAQLEAPNEKLSSKFSSIVTSPSESGLKNDGSDSDNSSEEEGKLSGNDWTLFSSLRSFFSSDNDSVEVPEVNLEPVLDVFNVVDPKEEEEEEELSFMFTDSDDEQETDDGNIDIEGNY